ncbi:MAG: hypothetical protein QXW94_06755, partial [Desulfurococcaceae archaeon]
MDVLEWLQAHWIHIVYVVAAVLAALIVSKVLEGALRRSLVKRVSKPVIDNIARLTRYVILILAVIIALTSAGVDLTSALVAGGIIGIVIGFAAQASV